MKKILLIFMISLTFSLYFITDYDIFSMEFTMNDIGSLYDLGMGLAGGASVSLNIPDYIVQDATNLNDVDNAARKFLQDYSILRGINYSTDPSLSLETDPYKWLYNYQFGNTVKDAWQNYRINNYIDTSLKLPFSKERFSSWANYNDKWYENYINSFIPDDYIDIEVPDEYVTYINRINLPDNGYGFWWKDASNILPEANYNQTQISDNYDVFQGVSLKNSSWYSYGSSGFSPINDTSFQYKTYEYLYASSNILTLNVSFDGSIYTGNISFIDRLYPISIYHRGNNTGNLWIQGFVMINDNICSRPGSRSRDYTPPSSVSYSNASLDNVLTWFSTRFRNVNIYYNGDAWSIVGQPDVLTPTFPDVIDTDDDNPAYDIVVPTGDGDGYFDLTSIFDAIKEAIIGASDNDDTTDSDITIDDVIENDGLLDDIGEATAGERIAVNDVIGDTPIIDNTDDYPIIPLPDISDAFSGTTVLSELVAGTRASLPPEVDLAFWGVVSVLVIIGIIKILHK